MQKSGFFNALLSNGEYDRKYNANDYCDNLAVVISNGVLRGVDDDLKVTSAGMIVSVGVGRAWINGHYYVNDTAYSFSAVPAPIGGARYDRVFLRLDKSLSVRSVSLYYQQGTAGNNPEKPAPTRNGDIYDIVLADIYVGTNATNVIVTDTRGDSDLCGWVYSTSGDNSFFTSLDAAFNEWFEGKKDTLASVTILKRYNWRTVLTTANNKVTFNIPQYNAETCFIEVYVNGILETDGVDYTAAGNVLTFSGTLVAGTEIEVKCYKSIDGTGIESITDEITELQNQVAAINKSTEYEYICNGVNDNVKISEIVRTFQAGEGYGSMRLTVYGTFGATAADRGSGTSSSVYGWFNFYQETAPTRRCVVDFTNCSAINLPIPDGTTNIVFYGNWVDVVGANVVANNSTANTIIRVFNSASGVIRCENSRFWVTSYQDSYISNTGTFTNCRGSIANIINNSYCFLTSGTGLLRINGGEYYAYTGGSSYRSAVIGQSAADAVTILYGVNAPTLARTNFYQTDAIMQFVGGGMLNCTDLVSALPVTVTAGISNIRGTIAKSKAGAM
jgi:hypothetical protein